MKNLKGYEIRNLWLKFFESKGHHIEASSPLVPINDNTLLWINAGVAPLKKYFDGRERPNNPRITNAQKCIRTNDIENVGKTARHHTFFEMLGNFSIGDYFKKEAIQFGFEILTSPEYFGFDLKNLYFTVYHTDHETYEIWKSLGVDESHLILTKHNFWEIGEGPCGPCTETFYDRGEKYGNGGVELIRDDIENDRYIEIWNIVFSQYNSTKGLSREEYPELPSKNIDTGMGLERMACVMQGVDTNYDTDLFVPIIRKIEEFTDIKYNGQMAYKVISDHVRTLTFAISDGAVLSNEGRGYVLRRVLRRALKYAKKLNINKAFMYLLVDTVVEIMNPFYPYLENTKDIVKQLIKKEEEKFLETLNQGEKKIEEIIKKNNSEYFSSKDAFMLYDTYGFPLELTLEYIEEANLKFNLDEYNKFMEEQKNNSRKSRVVEQSMGAQNEEFLNFKECSTFVGYEVLGNTTKIIKKFGNNVVLDNTPFYATSGGQCSDLGTINGYEVLDVCKLPNGQFLHILNENDLKENDEVECVVDDIYRLSVTKNHSACHLLHQALNDVLGSHVKQMGSNISYKELRFDFNNYTLPTSEEILKVEEIVNQKINESLPVVTHIMSVEEAKQTRAKALFGEKYEEKVRVVDMDYSVELCGGTHVSNTSDIKRFSIGQVESIGSGVYRITAYTDNHLEENLLERNKNILNEINVLNEKINHLVEEAKTKNINLDYTKTNRDFNPVSYQYNVLLKEELSELKEISKDLEKNYNRLLANQAVDNLGQYDQYIDGNVMIFKTENMEIKALKNLMDALHNKLGTGLVFICNNTNGNVTFVCKQNIDSDASLLVKEAALICDGKGGGKKESAQAGGKDASKIEEALNKVRSMVK